jgi:hypothetical protein
MIICRYTTGTASPTRYYDIYDGTTSTTDVTSVVSVIYRYKDSDTSYTGTNVVYKSVEYKCSIQKALKRMKDTLCKEGWIDQIPFYSQPKLQPLALRFVRLEGRGWANK